jgi:hypothetical protein
VTGGAGWDVFPFTAAALSAGAAVAGGSGINTVIVTTGGTVRPSHVIEAGGFELDKTARDVLILTSANLDGVSRGAISVSFGNTGDTVDAATLPSVDHIVVQGGAGKDMGGAGNDGHPHLAAADLFFIR